MLNYIHPATHWKTPDPMGHRNGGGPNPPLVVLPAGFFPETGPAGFFWRIDMNIDDLTIGQAKQLASLLVNQPITQAAAASPYDPWIGKNIAIRGVTMIDIGRLVAVYQKEIVIEDASWIPETERWAQFLSEGSYKECEPYPAGRVVIGRGSICEVSEWTHSIPRGQK